MTRRWRPERSGTDLPGPVFGSWCRSSLSAKRPGVFDVFFPTAVVVYSQTHHDDDEVGDICRLTGVVRGVGVCWWTAARSRANVRVYTVCPTA